MGENTKQQRDRWFEVEVVGRTAKAAVVNVILFRLQKNGQIWTQSRFLENVMLPLSQIKLIEFADGKAIVNVPFWLVKAKDMMALDLPGTFVQNRLKEASDYENSKRAEFHSTLRRDSGVKPERIEGAKTNIRF